MKELLEILEAMARRAGGIDNPQELFLDMAERVVKHISSSFGVKGDEVAILILTTDQKHLRFVAPRKFTELGTIPTTKRDSIAVGVFGKKSAEVLNNVPMVKHVSFYESVKLRERALPIQKMITVPIRNGDDIVGIAQISRKGESASEAGQDFTQADAKRAIDLFSAVGPVLFRVRPVRF